MRKNEKFEEKTEVKQNRKQRRSRKQGSQRRSSDTPSNPGRDRDNDPSWYANNESLLRDAASLSFSNALGTKSTFPTRSFVPRAGSNVSGGGLESSLVPTGVMGIGTIPTLGGAYDATDPITIAARNIYSFVRHANSGHSNYDSPNLMLYLLAMDSLYSVYSHCARMYGLIRTYSQRNRYLPRAIFNVVGWDYDNFMQNQVGFRYWLNTLAEKIGSLCVPASMTYMMRHMWMFQNVFADGMTAKAQMYFYYPTVMWRYNPVAIPLREVVSGTPVGDTDPRPGLVPVRLAGYPTTNPVTYAQVRAIVEGCIETIMSSEDLNIMSGDILKAFGPDKVWRLIPIHEDFSVIPVYSEEVLNQIHNTRVAGFAPGIFTPTSDSYGKAVIFEEFDEDKAYSWIKEDFSTGLYVQPDTSATLYDYQVYNAHKDDVTPGDVMVGTRMMYTTEYWVSPAAQGGSGWRIRRCGSELAVEFRVVRNAWDNDGKLTPQVKGVMSGYNLMPWDMESWGGVTLTDNMKKKAWTDAMAAIEVLSNFDKHPLIALYQYASSPAPTGTRFGYTWYGMFGDLENYTLIANETLLRMHETALLSEFNVPLMGSWAHNS